MNATAGLNLNLATTVQLMEQNENALRNVAHISNIISSSTVRAHIHIMMLSIRRRDTTILLLIITSPPASRNSCCTDQASLRSARLPLRHAHVRDDGAPLAQLDDALDAQPAQR